MVNINCTSRFSPINTQVILTQTDTTVGFLSQDTHKLQTIKSRPSNKPFIKVFKDFRSFRQNYRVPNKQKNLVRRSKKTTFIVKNQAFRVAPSSFHTTFLQHATWFYSTSANESGKKFDRVFCEEKADIIIEDNHSLHEGQASKLYKINNTKIKRLR